MWVGLSDGRVIGVPLAWFPRLVRATPAERDGFEISPFGIHWEALSLLLKGAAFRRHPGPPEQPATIIRLHDTR